MATQKPDIVGIVQGLAWDYSFDKIMDGSAGPIDTITYDMASDIIDEVQESYPDETLSHDYDMKQDLSALIREELISHWGDIFAATHLSEPQTSFFAEKIAAHVESEIDDTDNTSGDD